MPVCTLAGLVMSGCSGNTRSLRDTALLQSAIVYDSVFHAQKSLQGSG